MIEISLSQAVIELTGKKGFTVERDGTVEFFDKSTPPDPADVLAKRTEMENHYIVKRLDEYPSIAEQLDEIYHNGIDSWKTVIKVTKDKYPKG